MNPQGDLQAIVDATCPHGGNNSLHVKGGSSPAFLTMPLPTGSNKLYVRGHFNQTRQFGRNPGANYETRLGIRKDKDNEIRFGEIKGMIGVNEVPSDNITPKMDLSGEGPLVAPNKWVCLEVAFIGDQPQHEVHAWADGVEVIAVTSGALRAARVFVERGVRAASRVANARTREPALRRVSHVVAGAV